MRICSTLSLLVLAICLVFCAPLASAQATATPTATLTVTPTPEPYVYATLPPQYGAPGQMTRYAFTVSTGELQIANTLQWLLYSVWGMFLFSLFIYLRNKDRK